MTRQVMLLKIGGNELREDDFVPRLAQAIASRKNDCNCVMVHGGGRVIDDMMARLDVSPVYVEGQRFTDEEALEISEMVLSGHVNKLLVRALLAVDVDAVGLSGVDGGLLQVEPWAKDMGRVGRIVHVRTELFDHFFKLGLLPVLSPISNGPDGHYNVNADHAAGMVAGALGADLAVFISDVPGVMEDGQLVPQLTGAQAQGLIDQGKIYGGMIPKVNAALAALEQGARQTMITNLVGFINGSGTSIIKGSKQHV